MNANALRGILTLVGICMIVVGGQGSLLVFRERASLEIPLGEFQQRQPGNKWVRLTGAELDLLNARRFNYIESDHAAEFLVPLRPAGATNAPIHALVAGLEDEFRLRVDAIGLAEVTHAMNAFLATNAETLAVARDVEGLIRFGWEKVADNRNELRALHPRLVEDFVIIDAGAKPSWLLAMMLPGGIAIHFWLIWSRLSGRRRKLAQA